MLLRTVASMLLLLALWLAAPPVVAADAPELEVDGPLPRLGDRGPVEDAPDGVSVSPAVVEVAVEPGRRTEVVHVLANTTEEAVDLRLDTVALEVGSDGPIAPEGPSEPLTDDAEARVVAPVDELMVASGEGVELVSTAEATEGSSGAFALRAQTAGGEAVTGLVVVTDASLPSGLQATFAEADTEGTVTHVELSVDRHALIDVRLRVRSWTGVLSDRTLADLVVGPETPRILEVDRPVGAPPGRMHVEVVAVDHDGQEVRAELATDVGLTLPAVLLLVLVLIGLVGGAALLRRRLRSDAAAPPPTPPPSEEEHAP